MQERTIRRLLIVVVCALAVVALWVVTSRSVNGPQVAISSPPRPDPPGSAAPQASPTGPESPTGRESNAGKPPKAPSPPGGGRQPGPDRQPDPERPPAPEPSHGDLVPPGAVPAIHVVQNTYHQLTLVWGAATDNTGVVYYQVLLNGIPAGETASRQMTINWFNDDLGGDFVQVRAVDVAGNVSVRATPVMVTRPEPPSSATPKPTPSPADPAEPPEQDPSPTDAPPDTPTSDPQPDPGETSEPPDDPSTDPPDDEDSTSPSPSPSEPSTASPSPSPSPSPTPSEPATPTASPSPTPGASPSGKSAEREAGAAAEPAEVEDTDSGTGLRSEELSPAPSSSPTR